MQNSRHLKTLRMVQMAVLLALMILFAFTPLGYLRTPLVEITFMPLLVAMGAILFGPAGGAFFGLIFGITSFVQCFGIDAMGTLMFQWNPVGTVILLIGARVLCGWLTGLIFRGLQKIDRTKIVSYYAASLSTAVLNTVLYISAMLIFFWKDERFIGMMEDFGAPTETIWVFIVAVFMLNGVVEALVNCIVGGSAAKVINKVVNKTN